MRNYFYSLDCNGLLYLQGSPRNITSAFKDIRFLDFFFSRVKQSPKTHPLALQGYTHQSQCGNEMNWLKVEKTPVVFHSIDQQTQIIAWAGSLALPFNPNEISVCQDGYFYHSISARMPTAVHGHPIGLLKSSLVLTDLTDFDRSQDDCIVYKGKQYSVKRIFL